jgi:hypothetical protein
MKRRATSFLDDSFLDSPSTIPEKYEIRNSRKSATKSFDDRKYVMTRKRKTKRTKEITKRWLASRKSNSPRKHEENIRAKSDLRHCFGDGKRRSLWPGELSLVLSILKDLTAKDRNLSQLSAGVVARKVLSTAQLEELLQFPNIVK